MSKNKTQKNIPDGWDKKKLSEIGRALIGLTYSPDDVVQSGGTLVFRSSNIKSGKIDYSNQVRVSVSISEKNFVKEGDILICARNGSRNLIGKNAYISKNDEGNVFGAFMTVFRSKNPKYIYQLFQSFLYKKEIEKDLGPTINQVTTGNLSNFKFLLPSLPEQNRIVAVLEVWDGAIEKLGRKIEIKKQIKKGLMQNLLTGKKRLSGFKEKWGELKLKTICNIQKGKQLNKHDMIVGGKYPALNGGMGVSGYTNEWNTKENTITISEGGNSCGYLNFNKEKFWCGGHCYAVNPKNNIDNLFLYQALKVKQNKIMCLRVGSGLPNIQKKALDDLKVLIPMNLQEQIAIAKILTTADREIESLEKKKGIIEEQKKFLLNNLVTGRIRV